MTLASMDDKNFEMISRLREQMITYRPRRLPIPLVPQAAVLFPITLAAEPEVILTVRTQDMPTHAGQVAFPGGRHEKGETLQQTALREANEEVGITANQVELLGALSPVMSRHRMKVTPFVGLVAPDILLRKDPREIDEIFRVPLRFFVSQEPEMSEVFRFMGKRIQLPNYYYDNKRIWGLTACMIIDFINHVFEAGIELEAS